MIISSDIELKGMQAISEVVATTLKQMMDYAQVGMSTKELDEYGGSLLAAYGAKSAPFLTYGFPGWTCISVDKEFCHGIPSEKRILKEGDLINIDVSAELNGFWGDNGASFTIGKDINNRQKLIAASKSILQDAINQIQTGVKIADIGYLMETEAKDKGFKVIKNLGGHGIGRGLHEAPNEILNYKNRFDQRRFQENSVVAIETFIATTSSMATTLKDGWTMVGNKGGYMAQHEHTIVVTNSKPMILTAKNEIFG